MAKTVGTVSIFTPHTLLGAIATFGIIVALVSLGFMLNEYFVTQDLPLMPLPVAAVALLLAVVQILAMDWIKTHREFKRLGLTRVRLRFRPAEYRTFTARDETGVKVYGFLYPKADSRYFVRILPSPPSTSPSR